MTVHAVDKLKIKIEGIEGELLKNVSASLSIEQQKTHPRLTSSRIKRLHQQAPEEIKRALQPFGYYQATVTAELTPLQSAPNLTNDEESLEESTNWQAHYWVELGEPIKLQIVQIVINGDGKSDTAFQKLITDFPLKPKEILNHPRYEQSKRALINLAEERGYFDAKLVQHEISIDETAYTASILFTFDTGTRYRFGTVTFKQEGFDEAVLTRFLTFKSGDFYTADTVLSFKNALNDSDYFANIEVETQKITDFEEKTVAINVVLERHKPNRYSIGIGYGTDTGVRGSAEWERRYINEYGHRFTAQAQLSQVRKSVTTRYFIPVGQLREDYFAISAGYKDEKTSTSHSKIWLMGVSKNQARTLFNTKLREVISLEYRDEEYDVGGESGHAKLLIPSISWSYIKADNRIYAMRGHKLQLDIRGAMKKLGSNASFAQARLSATWIRKITSQGRIIVRGDAGYTVLQGQFADLPPSIRFFAGGDRSVRGYDYNTLGSKNSGGYVTGGRYLTVGSLEYEHKILEKWSLAMFSDMGNAFNSPSEPLKRGAGVGVRWESPVGLIRIDIASALSESGHPLRLHLTIGPDF